MTVIRVEGHGFVAGAVLRDDVVVRAAPIIKYMIGWHSERVFRYSKSRRWRAVRL